MHTRPGGSGTLTDGQMVDCQEVERREGSEGMTSPVGNSDDLRDNERRRSC